MAMLPKSSFNKYSMETVSICPKCSDAGFMYGSRQSIRNPHIHESWKEPCPYCMPTNKYGNLQETLKSAPKLLEDKRIDDEKNQ